MDYMCWSRTIRCTLYVVEEILDVCSVQVVAREVMNQRLCFHHPHIIQFREVFLTPDHLAIVSEFAAGGDLADYIDRHQAVHKQAGMTESNALWLFHQLVTGVNFCHQVSLGLSSYTSWFLHS